MTRRLSKSPDIRFLCEAAVTFFIIALPASAQQSDRTPSIAALHSNAPKSMQALPIFYDPALAAQGFPSPLVKARIAGQEALFIIDSGASVNALADWYAKVAKIPSSTNGSTATGSGGKTSAARVAHQIQGHWSDGERLSLKEAIVVAFPPLFMSLHLGGLLSPQLLAPVGMAAVLDLKIPSLQFVPFARALSDLQRSKASTVPPALTQACQNTDSKVVNRQYLAPVAAAGVTDLVLIDTGATKTIFSEDSKIGQAIRSDSELGPRSEGVGGAVNGRRIVRGVQLLRGGRIVGLDPSIGEVKAPCDAKGLLGMDALHSCLLILGSTEMAFSCD
jgi:hypothetical protein